MTLRYKASGQVPMGIWNPDTQRKRLSHGLVQLKPSAPWDGKPRRSDLKDLNYMHIHWTQLHLSVTALGPPKQLPSRSEALTPLPA